MPRTSQRESSSRKKQFTLMLSDAEDKLLTEAVRMDQRNVAAIRLNKSDTIRRAVAFYHEALRRGRGKKELRAAP